MRSINELKDIKGKRVLLRLDLNAPIVNSAITDPFRIDRALKSIQFLVALEARVILVSHLSDSRGSLVPVYEYLKKKIPLTFVNDIAGVEAHQAVMAIQDGEVVLLQNIRMSEDEKKNDAHFAHELASLADIYVNDAFPASHRAHASIVGIPDILPSYAGFQFLDEVRGLTPALTPISPSLAIVGGAKLTTKVALIETLLKKYDSVFVGGAIANDFFKAKGYEVGVSLVSGASTAGTMLGNPKIILPEFVTVEGPQGRRDILASEVGHDEAILDIAPASIQALQSIITASRSILWNGPMGNFEKGFTAGTDALAIAIASSSAKSIVGGGDTLSSIQNLGLMDKFTFVSTAGGAMLDFLANGTLPGIDALEKKT
ncbi:MAG: phosphoglycerate kinase [Candidatus Paceibacterota bacterium]